MYASDTVKRRHPIGAAIGEEATESIGYDQSASYEHGRGNSEQLLHDDYDPYGPSIEKHRVYHAHANAIQQQQQQRLYHYPNYHPLARPPRQYSSNKYLAFVQRYDDYVIPAFLTLVSFWTRFYDIGAAGFVVWDEAHFGKFGSYYIKREFYFDVHPPLAKMLVGLSGVLAGYDGSFEFKSGETYPEHLNIWFMRIFNAFFGAVMVPFAYYTAREMQFSVVASAFAATMILFDNAYLTISRFVLLDSMLLSSTCLVTYCLVKFRNERWDPFSLDWWLWLAMTGVSIGLVSSVKWVGLFATALVGLHTIEELWDLFGDLSLPKMQYLKHWIARSACLIALPFAVYVASFVCHFAILNRSGSGDAQMSSLFQAGLIGNNFRDNPLYVAYGSKVTIKNTGYGGGLLHSHVQTYPEGSGQQQVTCYHHKDNNNNWLFRKIRGAVVDDENEIEFVKNGDTLRLVHESTGRNLHSHRVKAPITTSQWEVSGYGDESSGDSNDDWVVEIAEEQGAGEKDDRVRSLTTRFRLRHKMLGCLLSAENANLPQWGFKQIEVFCDQRNRTKSDYSIWNIEHHWNEKLPAGAPGQYKSSFWRNFWHLNVAMMTSNNALVPDPDKEDILSSNPSQWPMMAVGLRMSSWAANQVKFYLLGNPMVWWSSSLSIVIYMATLAVYVIRRQRKFMDLTPAEWEQFQYVGKIAVLGWFLHYLPFCVMGRVTYLHHYFPALYFSIFLVPFLIEHFLRRVRNAMVHKAVWTTVFVMVTATFWYFRAISFGIYGQAEDTMTSRQWRAGWNIIDDHKPGMFI
ncbi:Protein O-mannosyltransferase 2 [Actinomortierella ambigua]|uniref:Dolichyl-phosphate-mannose--protein mannosyltransferase n=1 Tax=Actinomortierella ambigua TaxID=1343610 RepID=A0A9P6UA70_9FUNG|nr:Protein O-mannosyltransferase 2 [Actinomortierella ambigua]